MDERSGSSLRSRLRQDGSVGAFWFSLGSPALVEVSLQAEPDVIVIDAQHGVWDRVSTEYAIGAAAPRPPVLVRTADHSRAAISQALDAGAEGVIAPLIEMPSRRPRWLRAGRYPRMASARAAASVRSRITLRLIMRLRTSDGHRGHDRNQAGRSEADAIAGNART